jgi:hypothetical protein
MKKELDRIIKYAQSMGISVIFKPRPRNWHKAEWVTDGSEITIFTSARESYTSKILDLVHELAHHRAFVSKKRKISSYIENVFMKADDTTPLTKTERRIIWKEERDDSKWQEVIYNELNLKIPLYKLYLERDISNWVYKQYYVRGKFPTYKELRLKRKELKKEIQCRLKNK